MTIPKWLGELLFLIAGRVLRQPRERRRDLLAEEDERALRREMARRRARQRAVP